MFHAVDDTWRWRFRVGDRYFGRFWTQTIRFLARSKILGQKKAEIQTERKRYLRNQPIEIKVRFPNPADAPKLGRGERRGRAQGAWVAADDSEGGQGKPERCSRELSPRPSKGNTRSLLPPPVLEGGLPSTTFGVDPPAGERERTQMNEPELVRAATTSGGKFYTPSDADSLLKDLPEAAAGPARHRPADPALEHLAGPGAVPDLAGRWNGFSENGPKWYSQFLRGRGGGMPSPAFNEEPGDDQAGGCRGAWSHRNSARCLTRPGPPPPGAPRLELAGLRPGLGRPPGGHWPTG